MRLGKGRAGWAKQRNHSLVRTSIGSSFISAYGSAAAIAPVSDCGGRRRAAEIVAMGRRRRRPHAGDGGGILEVRESFKILSDPLLFEKLCIYNPKELVYDASIQRDANIFK